RVLLQVQREPVGYRTRYLHITGNTRPAIESRCRYLTRRRIRHVPGIDPQCGECDNDGGGARDGLVTRHEERTTIRDMLRKPRHREIARRTHDEWRRHASRGRVGGPTIENRLIARIERPAPRCLG